MGDRQQIEAALDQGQGVLRLAPAWVPSSFCIPGRRMRLHPDDHSAFGANRGGIDEPWFASTTRADNGPLTTLDKGMSYVHVEDGRKSARLLFKDALELMGNEILGPALQEGGYPDTRGRQKTRCRSATKEVC